ncbi:hypothetical protein [Taibaiella chishuiensis]|uniref:Uncharacterized protein n=1 Tax=Taibaiella chishuiensis TaxID=1434707 RepID=A0A2P8D3D6_9BACT|nr:hypothetical protein [Taibaiella chishuiensis]PSK91696.1 hypothetical protein B0I18_105281 [Taibaiella chishuiensis]
MTMKSILVLLSILIITGTTVFGQDSTLKEEQIQSIEKLIRVFKTKSKRKIADLVYYPLRREYPLKDVKHKNDFIRRFDDIFDRALIDLVAKSKIDDWSEVGWRGIMLENGILWISDEGKIMTVNYQSPREKQLLVHAIQDNRNQLPKSLQQFNKPLYLIFTKHYKIRIDKKADGIYRYAAWKIRQAKSEPDIIVENGVLEFHGSGGNHTITFKNNAYTYAVSIIEIGSTDTPDAILEVLKDGKTILTEDGDIKRN